MVEPGTPRSFVVRIWLEGETESNATWRGHIQHVQGEEEQYFENLSEMREFLERIGGVPLPTKDKAESDG